MLKIKQGDVTSPIGDGKKIIAHSCNNIGGFGSGIAGCLAKKWPIAREKYLEWFNSDYNFELGEIMLFKVTEDIAVCHIIGQKGIGSLEIDGIEIRPVKYDAILEGLARLRNRIKKIEGKVSVHLPLLGAALGGGTIDETYLTIHKVFGNSDVECVIYAFSDEDWKWLQSIHEAVNMKREDIEKLPKGRKNIVEKM